MWIACDEAGHTGPDLLAKDQRYFAFASVKISDEDARRLIHQAREKFPVQMPELKASKLLGSNQGRRLISHIIEELDGRFAVNAHDKLLALCGWVFEYIFEPVYQHDPKIFYEKDFHRFVAMYCYLWFNSETSEAKDTLSQFQELMRSKDTGRAPMLFNFDSSKSTRQPEPFELIRRFATAHRRYIEQEINEIVEYTADKGTWTLDLSASGLWSHLNHWGSQGEPLSVLCDDSKPLRAIQSKLSGTDKDPAIMRARGLLDADKLGWTYERPLEFVDSRAHPSVQIADILASTVAYCYTNGLPTEMELTGQILDRGMLRESIFPDLDRVNLENPAVRVHYAVLYELAMTAEGKGTGLPIEEYFRITEDAVASGDLAF